MFSLIEGCQITTVLSAAEFATRSPTDILNTLVPKEFVQVEFTTNDPLPEQSTACK